MAAFGCLSSWILTTWSAHRSWIMTNMALTLFIVVLCSPSPLQIRSCHDRPIILLRCRSWIEVNFFRCLQHKVYISTDTADTLYSLYSVVSFISCWDNTRESRAPKEFAAFWIRLVISKSIELSYDNTNPKKVTLLTDLTGFTCMYRSVSLLGVPEAGR